MSTLDKVNALPSAVRTWIGSEEVTNVILNLNNKLSPTGVTNLAAIVFYLVDKELAPDAFIGEIAKQLSISPSSAREVAHELEEKVLKPIKKELLDSGVDIALIQQTNVPAASVESKHIGSEMPTQAKFDSNRILPSTSPRITPPSTGSGQAPPSFKIEMSGGTHLKAPGMDSMSAPKVAAAPPPPPAPKVVESMAPKPAPISFSIAEKKTGEMKAAPNIPGSMPAAARGSHMPETPKAIGPQALKIEPGLIPTLKEEGDKIRLKEEAPFILHEEKSSIEKPVEEIATFKSQVGITDQKPVSKPVTARVEIGGAELKVVNYDEKKPVPMAPPPAPQRGVSGSVSSPPTPPPIPRPIPQATAPREPVSKPTPPSPQPATPALPPREPEGWLKSAAPKPPLPPKPAPTPGASNPPSPKVEGNTVDLR